MRINEDKMSAKMFHRFIVQYMNMFCVDFIVKTGCIEQYCCLKKLLIFSQDVIGIQCAL